jgi:predicted outer membrane protein
MVDDHKTDIDLFKKAADDLPDQELKAFASSKLSVLKLHQDSADAVKASLKK